MLKEAHCKPALYTILTLSVPYFLSCLLLIYRLPLKKGFIALQISLWVPHCRDLWSWVEAIDRLSTDVKNLVGIDLLWEVERQEGTPSDCWLFNLIRSLAVKTCDIIGYVLYPWVEFIIFCMEICWLTGLCACKNTKDIFKLYRCLKNCFFLHRYSAALGPQACSNYPNLMSTTITANCSAVQTNGSSIPVFYTSTKYDAIAWGAAWMYKVSFNCSCMSQSILNPSSLYKTSSVATTM